MAAITYKALGALIVTNAAAAAAAITCTEAQAAALGRLLAVMDDDKVLAPMLKLSATDKGNLTTSP